MLFLLLAVVHHFVTPRLDGLTSQESHYSPESFIRHSFLGIFHAVASTSFPDASIFV